LKKIARKVTESGGRAPGGGRGVKRGWGRNKNKKETIKGGLKAEGAGFRKTGRGKARNGRN